MELERILRSQGFGSRPECRALIHGDRVQVEGNPCDDPFADFSPAGLRFAVDEQIFVVREKVYVLLNKPADVECSHKPKFHPSVYSLLPRHLITRGVQAVGRLDEDTTGFLLLSDDGQFIHTYTSPKKKIPKVYDVTLKHPLDAAQIDGLLKGVELNDEPVPIAATSCEQLSDELLRMTVTEGKYHLVKRMIAAAHNRVVDLHRVAVGGLWLPSDLAIGQWRFLEADDLQRLKTFAPLA